MPSLTIFPNDLCLLSADNLKTLVKNLAVIFTLSFHQEQNQILTFNRKQIKKYLICDPRFSSLK